MVFLARKNGVVVAHTDLAAMKSLDGISKAEKTLSNAEWEAKGGFARIIDNKIVVGKTQAEIAAEEALNAAEAETANIKAEIASRDYRALKAQKLGKPIDTLYPGETDWYKEQLARLAELDAIIAENAAA